MNTNNQTHVIFYFTKEQTEEGRLIYYLRPNTSQKMFIILGECMNGNLEDRLKLGLIISLSYMNLPLNKSIEYKTIFNTEYKVSGRIGRKEESFESNLNKYEHPLMDAEIRFFCNYLFKFFLGNAYK